MSTACEQHHSFSSKPEIPQLTQSTMDFSNAALPAHYGLTFTPTFHSQIPATIDPTLVTLPRPFVAVVTGAGKGLGYHISLAFARTGCSGLAISSRTREDLVRLESEVGRIARETGRSVDVLTVVCDVRSDAEVERLEREVRGRWGRVDVVVANAGVISSYISSSSSASASDSASIENEGKEKVESNLPQGLVHDADWARVLDINLNGVWRVSRAFLPAAAC